MELLLLFSDDSSSLQLLVGPFHCKGWPFTLYAGYGLTIKRLVISSTLAPASGAIKLLPLGLVSEAPHNLTLMDVGFVISQQEFDDYLKLFSKQLRSNSTDLGTGPSMLTVSARGAYFRGECGYVGGPRWSCCWNAWSFILQLQAHLPIAVSRYYSMDELLQPVAYI